MDGLLIDSEVLWHEAEIEILGALGVPLSTAACRTTKGMFVYEVTAHWHGLHPWGPDPAPDDVAVTIVDRVIELIVTTGSLKPGAEHAIELCAARRVALGRGIVVGVPADRGGVVPLRLARPLRRRPLGRGRGVRQAAPGRVPHRRRQARGVPQAVPRVGGRAGRRAGRKGGVDGVHRGARAGRGRPAGVRAGRPRGRLAARGHGGDVGGARAAPRWRCRGPARPGDPGQSGRAPAQSSRSSRAATSR